MSRFPFFKEVNGFRALVIGGGEVALRRAAALADAGVKVTCIAETFCEGFSLLNAECVQRRLEATDIVDWDIVIAATDDKSLNASAAHFARSQGSEVNVADAPELSTFIFPGIVHREGMTIAISSNGKSPSAVKYIRERIEASIPEHFEEVLGSMETARRIAKIRIPEEKRRAKVLRRMFDFCISAPEQPAPEEIERMIHCWGSAELD